jgi:hypothetical protein
MLTRTVVVAALFGSACIVPHKTHTTRRISHVIDAPLPDPNPSVLVVRTEARMVHVRALRVCRAHAHDLVEDTTHVTADLVGMSSMPARPSSDRPTEQQSGGGAFELALLAVTGVATALDIAAEDGEVHVRRVRAPDESLPCPMALRNIEVEVELPSGRHLSGTTDDTGAVDLEVPDGEVGDLTVHAPGMEPQTARMQ